MNSTEYQKRISDQALELLNEDMPRLTNELFLLFEKTGNRTEYEKAYFLRRKFLAVYGLYACFYAGAGNDAFSSARNEISDKLNTVLEDILSEETWALPAHCNTSEADWKYTVDLFACETGSALSLIYKYSGTVVSKRIKERIKKEIKRRIIDRVFDPKLSFGWEMAPHNWNAVCMGSLGIILINMGRLWLDSEALNRAFGRVERSLSAYIDNAFMPDGSCLEGLGYYNYGLSYFTAYADMAEKKRGNKWYSKERLKKIAIFPGKLFLENGMTVNFSDASANEKLHSGMIKILASEVPCLLGFPKDRFMGFDDDQCYRFAALYEDVKHSLCDKTVIADVDHFLRLTVFPDAEWVIAEGKGSSFAIKGGNNNEPHNHNDVGHFIFVLNDKVISCDLGAGEYTKDYFGSKRYDILCNSSLGHSLPVIDGKGEKEGENAKATDFKIYKDKKIKVTMDLSRAYPYENILRVKRIAEYDRDGRTLLILDEVEAKDRIDVKTRIVSFLDIEKNITCLSGKGIKVVNEVFSDHEGIKKDVKIFEITGEETTDEHSEREHHGKRLYSMSYLLHP